MGVMKHILMACFELNNILSENKSNSLIFSFDDVEEFSHFKLFFFLL